MQKKKKYIYIYQSLWTRFSIKSKQRWLYSEITVSRMYGSIQDLKEGIHERVNTATGCMRMQQQSVRMN